MHRADFARSNPRAIPLRDPAARRAWTNEQVTAGTFRRRHDAAVRARVARGRCRPGQFRRPRRRLQRPGPGHAAGRQPRHHARRTTPDRRPVRRRPVGLGAGQRPAGLRGRAVQPAGSERAGFGRRDIRVLGLRPGHRRGHLVQLGAGRCDLGRRPGTGLHRHQLAVQFRLRLLLRPRRRHARRADQLPRRGDARVWPRTGLPELRERGHRRVPGRPPGHLLGLHLRQHGRQVLDADYRPGTPGIRAPLRQGQGPLRPPPAGQISFLDVVMHEFGHGLGFQNFENEATGAFLADRQDIYSVFTFDNTAGKYWTQMTDLERQASAINYGKVVFDGARATLGAGLTLDPRTAFRATAPAALAGEYEYGTASFGPAITPANFSGTVVLGTDGVGAGNDGCEPLSNPAVVAGNLVLLDRGACTFVIKAQNAQAAGATGMVIADNVAGTPPPALGGTDPGITIPSIRIPLADGNAFKANLPAQVGLVVDPDKLQGADDEIGRAHV